MDPADPPAEDSSLAVSDGTHRGTDGDKRRPCVRLCLEQVEPSAFWLRRAAVMVVMGINQPVVLVVDDEVDTLKYLSTNLALRGCVVLSAEGGVEALQVFNSNPIDLVLLDVTMPGMSGFEVCQQIRAVSRVPIIVLSARSQMTDKVTALDLGADDFLQKPFGVAELMARVNASLNRRRKGSGAYAT